MSNARIDLAAQVRPNTEFVSCIIDPLPKYPHYAGAISADLVSGVLDLRFSWGYASPAVIHAGIANLRAALDQLDIDVDAAMERQAAARPERTRGEQVVDEEWELGEFDAASPAEGHEIVDEWTRKAAS